MWRQANRSSAAPDLALEGSLASTASMLAEQAVELLQSESSPKPAVVLEPLASKLKQLKAATSAPSVPQFEMYTRVAPEANPFVLLREANGLFAEVAPLFPKLDTAGGAGAGAGGAGPGGAGAGGEGGAGTGGAGAGGGGTGTGGKGDGTYVPKKDDTALPGSRLFPMRKSSGVLVYLDQAGTTIPDKTIEAAHSAIPWVVGVLVVGAGAYYAFRKPGAKPGAKPAKAAKK